MSAGTKKIKLSEQTAERLYDMIVDEGVAKIRVPYGTYTGEEG